MRMIKIMGYVLDKRKLLKMTQKELATALGVTSTAVAMWERGERPTTKMHELAIEAVMRRRGLVVTQPGDKLPNE